jgi:inosine-uridine nucleoside N-ribohydrolase
MQPSLKTQSRMKPIFLALVLLTIAAIVHGRDAPVPPRSRPVLLTTDVGVEVDDQWALAHLVLSPEFDLRGIVTTHAGSYPLLAAPAAESSARAANEVLDHLPLSKRPKVVAGSSEPLKSKTEPRPGPGVDFILKEARGLERSRPLTVLVIGAATDVASALLTDPKVAERIEIVAMGFDKWPEGNDVFNVKNDIKAWQVLLESATPIVVADASVTREQLRMTREGARTLLESRGKPGRYLAGLLVDWVERQGDLVQMVTGGRNAWPIWDEATVAYMLGLTTSEVHPRPRLRDDLQFTHSPPAQSTPPTIRWITRIDSKRLWEDFGRKLDNALREQSTK